MSESVFWTSKEDVPVITTFFLFSRFSYPDVRTCVIECAEKAQLGQEQTFIITATADTKGRLAYPLSGTWVVEVVHETGEKLLAKQGAASGTYSEVQTFTWRPTVEGIPCAFCFARAHSLKTTFPNRPLSNPSQGRRLPVVHVPSRQREQQHHRARSEIERGRMVQGLGAYQASYSRT